eukprot:gene10098-11178_t
MVKGQERSGDLDSNGEFAPNTLESAAHEAAMADGLIPAENSAESKVKKAGLRRGKWTAEEEAYANRLIYEFKLGLLPLTDGTTLRTFLSKLLNCDPMRISKKFVGQNCIGKQVFRRRQQDLEKLTQEQIETSRKELAELERKFLERVAQTNRSKSSGGVKVKDGRLGYEDENGNPVLAPWMVPPDDQAKNQDTRLNSQLPSHPPPSHLPGYGQGPYSNHPQPPSSAGFSNNGEVHPMDYHSMVSANAAGMMAHLYQPGQNGQMPQYPFIPNYPYQFVNPADYAAAAAAVAAAAANNAAGSSSQPNLGEMDSVGRNFSSSSFDMFYGLPSNQSLENMYRSTGSFPWSLTHGQPSNGNVEGNPPASSSEASLRHGASLTSAEWPSFSNLIGMNESVENIHAAFGQSLQARLAASSNEQSTGDIKVKAEGDSNKEDNARKNRPRTQSEDIGFPIDEHSSPPNASMPYSASAFPVRSFALPRPNDTNSSGGSSGGGTEGKLPDISGHSRPPVDLNGYTLPNDAMSVLAPMYHQSGVNSDSRSNKSAVSAPPISNAQILKTEAANGSGNNGSSSMPRNSSVDNFWMLVDMGDLPRPDNDVLSETLWQAHSQRGVGAPSTAPLDGTRKFDGSKPYPPVSMGLPPPSIGVPSGPGDMRGAMASLHHAGQKRNETEANISRMGLSTYSQGGILTRDSEGSTNSEQVYKKIKVEGDSRKSYSSSGIDS